MRHHSVALGIQLIVYQLTTDRHYQHLDRCVEGAYVYCEGPRKAPPQRSRWAVVRLCIVMRAPLGVGYCLVFLGRMASQASIFVSWPKQQILAVSLQFSSITNFTDSVVHHHCPSTCIDVHTPQSLVSNKVGGPSELPQQPTVQWFEPRPYID